MIDGNWVRKRVDQVLLPVVTYFLQTYASLLAEITVLTTDFTNLQTTVTNDITTVTNLIGTDISALATTISQIYAPLNSPPLVGTPTAPTQQIGDNSTKLATTAFVVASVAAATTGVSQVVGFTGAISLAELVEGGVAPLGSPGLTGTPTAPTPTAGDNSTKLATTAFAAGLVSTAIRASLPAAANSLLGSTATAGAASVVGIGTNLSLVAGVLNATYTYILPTATATVLGGVKPDGVTITNTAGVITVTYGAAANTAAQGNDARIVGALQATVAATTYAPLVSPPLSGNPTAPTQTPGDNSTKLATTAFVAAAITADDALTTLAAPVISPGGNVLVTNLQGLVCISNVAAAATTVTLPATPGVNERHTIKDLGYNAQLGNITISGNGHLFDNATATLVIDYDGGAVNVWWSGSYWVEV